MSDIRYKLPRVTILSEKPKDLGFTFPAEWETQEALWLSWPHKKRSWPGKIETIFPAYSQFVARVAENQKVCINVNNDEMEGLAKGHLFLADCNMKNVQFYLHPTNDAWCRDHGPAFLVNRETKQIALVDWEFNAWGKSYRFDRDNLIPQRIAGALDLPMFQPKIIMEGGAVDSNGAGTLLTTTSCLLNKNRNPHLSQAGIEKYLRSYYGQEKILWLGDGIVGDDTDGHVDDLARFVSEDVVITMIEHDKSDANYKALNDNARMLENMTLADGKKFRNIFEIAMPKPIIYKEMRLPASYANFLIANEYVIVPMFGDEKRDEEALVTLQSCFEGRKKVIGIDSLDIIWGLGSFHCLSQPQFAV